MSSPVAISCSGGDLPRPGDRNHGFIGPAKPAYGFGVRYDILQLLAMMATMVMMVMRVMMVMMVMMTVNTNVNI